MELRQANVKCTDREILIEFVKNTIAVMNIKRKAKHNIDLK